MHITIEIRDSDIFKLKDKGYTSEKISELLKGWSSVVTQTFAELAEGAGLAEEPKKSINDTPDFEKWVEGI